jgi:hypothetical protein
MCFSTAASFGLSGILAIAGIISVKKVKLRSQYLFACIPFIFAIQQLTEGFVWLSLSGTDFGSWQRWPTYVFLLFAQVIWPIWVPLSILLIEKVPIRRKIISLLLGLGCLLALYLSYCLLHYKVSSEITPYHIHYDLYFPAQYTSVIAVFYFLPIVITPFVSGIKRMTGLGVLIFISFLITRLFFSDFVISVWCFLAALVSFVVIRVMGDLREDVSAPNR